MSAYREIRAGDIGVTIITEGRTVWVAATVGGKCRSAFGMYHGPVRSLLTGEDLDTPKRWRPCYWRHGTRNAYGDSRMPNHHGHAYVVAVAVVHRQRGALGLRPWRAHRAGCRTITAIRPAGWPGRLADRVRQHLEATYRNG